MAYIDFGKFESYVHPRYTVAQKESVFLRICITQKMVSDPPDLLIPCEPPSPTRPTSAKDRSPHFL